MHALRLLAVACALFPATLAADALIERAGALLEAGEPQQAYALLAAEAAERGGDPEFDLALGVAALEAGEPAQAAFALERVLAVDPDHARARTELARAYFLMGENEAAREEFSNVRRQTLPPAQTRAIDDYLSAIDARLRAQQRRIGIFIEAAAGWDSNVNSATDSSQVALPAFGNIVFTLDRSGRELDSGFFEVNGGMAFNAPFLARDDLRIFGAADLHERITVEEEDFRTRGANGQLGLRHERGADAFLVSLLAQRFWIDGDPNRDQGGVLAQWQHAFGRRTQASLFGQWAMQRFPGQEVRDVDQFSLGAGLVHQFEGAGAPIVYASVYGGGDDEQDNARDDIGRSFAGVRVGGQYAWNARTLLTGGASWQWSRYGDEDPLFLERRRDHFILLRAGIEYALNRNWSLRPELQYANNDSTLPVNDFDRWQLLMTVRNDF